jgi:uncharacterized protein YjbI with pentapeptide repeats
MAEEKEVVSEQDGRQASALQRPLTNNPEAWQTYWEAEGQAWRSEPEIDTKRQEELAERRAIIPDIRKGVYPFKGVKLSRADVEWLLATHEREGICGPVEWSDVRQHKREGLDLRGADLREVDLHHLPLARVCGGLTLETWGEMTEEQMNAAAILLERAALWKAQLQEACLNCAQLQKADLNEALLQKANLYGAQLQGADLRRADLEDAKLDAIILSDEKHGATRLADIKWGDVNLAVVDWQSVKILGDERQARQRTDTRGISKGKQTRLGEYKMAVRANRQLAVVLRDQGLNEEADHFAYRAQRLQRIVSRMQRKYGRYLFWGFLDLLAGYGYRPLRSLFWYLVIIFGFALTYYTFGHLSLWPPDAFIYSLTSFHGRGFFPGLEGKRSLHDPLIMFAAFEAVVGLFIEISFIATFTQRFFGR